mgnify:CR=1 FL=1
MPKTRSTRIDVSGDTDERGRLINRDIPEDARRGAGVKKKKRVDSRKAKADIVIEDHPTKKRKKKRVEEEPVVVKKKKRRPVEEEPVKKKKKKSLALIDGPATKGQLAKAARRKEKMEREIVFLPADGGSNDEFDQQYRAMFEKLRTIIELFEEKMLSGDPNGRDVYALSTIYSQMREVIADIRSAKDVTSQIAELESKAYGAFLKLIGQSYIDLFFKLQKDLRMFVKDKDAQLQMIASLEGVVKDETDKVQAGYSVMLERVRTVLT